MQNNQYKESIQPMYRMMTLDDLDDIMEIEHACFSLPWKREAFYRELTSNQYAHYWVVEINGQVVGYSGIWIVLDEGHITNIAVLPEYRGQGLGKKLLLKIMKLAQSYHALTLTLEVRLSNTVAQQLYKSIGFQNGGIRKGYYTDNQEDALVMWVKMP